MPAKPVSRGHLRQIPCPLCGVKVKIAHLSKSGICIACEDSRAQELTVSAKQAASEETRAEDVALARYELLNKTKTRLKADAEEAARREALRTKEREYSSAERELASRELARRSLLHYTERRVPKYDASWAHELVASQIEEFLDEVAAGKSPRMILSLSSRFGKQVADSTPVFTENRAWITHGDLVPGDFVFGLDGYPTRVVAVAPPIPCDMEVEFASGEVIVTHSNHEWMVIDTSRNNPGVRGKVSIMETKGLHTTKYGKKRMFRHIRDNSPKGRCVYQVPTTPRLEISDIDLPMHPYALGAWLGDGTSTAPVITHHPAEMEVVAKLITTGYEPTSSFYNFKAGSAQTRFGSTEAGESKFSSELRAAAVFGNKHIPEIYFRAGTEQRLELLAGILDTDGTTDKNGRITLVTTSERLRDDYLKLVRTLGWRPYITAVEPALSSSGIQGKKVVYQVGFQPDRGDIPCALERKRPKRLVRVQGVGIHDTRYITNGPLGRCIQVEAEDGMYLVGEHLIPTHNSELASMSTPLWALGHHPTWRFVLASYSDVLPVEFSRTIRAELQSDDYRELFPEGGELSPDDASVKAWSTTQGGALRATGVGGGLLGFGADVLIIDDPVKDVETAENPDALEKLWQWFSSVAYSRLLPGGGILVIQQRMSVNDLVGRLIQNQRNEEARLAELRQDIEDLTATSDLSSEVEREIVLLTEEADELDSSMDRWRYLEYPALATFDEYYSYTTGQIIRLNPGEAPDLAWKPLRKRGEALHEKRYSRSYLLKLKRNNPKMFQAMYMLNPLANEGQYFSVKDFRRYDYGFHPKLDQLHVFCAWDLAIGTKQQNDYTVGVAGGLDHQGQLWILDLVRGRFGDVADIANRVIDLHKKWGASITGIEHTVITLALGPVLARRQVERQEHIVLTEGKEKLVATVDKQVRARSLQGLCRAGKVLLPTGDEFDGMLAELTQFGSAGVHDDQVDAASWLAILALRTPPPRDPKEARHAGKEEKKSWLDELMEEVTSGIRGYMSS